MSRACLLAILLLVSGAAWGQDDVWSGIFKFQKTLAQKGDVDAMYQIGQMYAEGKGTAKDRDQALSWLEKARDAGHPEAAGMIETLKQPAKPEPPPPAPAAEAPTPAPPPKRAEPARTAPKPAPAPRAAERATPAPIPAGRTPAPASRPAPKVSTTPARPVEPPAAPAPTRATRSTQGTKASTTSTPSTRASTAPRPSTRAPAAAPRETPEAFPQGPAAQREAPVIETAEPTQTPNASEEEDTGFRGNPCASKAAKFTSLCR